MVAWLYCRVSNLNLAARECALPNAGAWVDELRESHKFSPLASAYCHRLTILECSAELEILRPSGSRTPGIDRKLRSDRSRTRNRTGRTGLCLLVHFVLSFLFAGRSPAFHGPTCGVNGLRRYPRPPKQCPCRHVLPRRPTGLRAFAANANAGGLQIATNP